jgi:gliding motility-associated transport system ATP-binding protein
MIQAQGLTKYYGDTCAIRDLDFEIESGEIVGILGLNGAGKTTTLKILSCLLLPSTGKVTINGLDIYENPHEIRKQVGFLPEEPPLYREMTVRAYLTFAAELRGLSRSSAESRVGKVMEATQTTEVADTVIANLSHGFRKRVGIGQSIVHQPPVLILDEPISGLDPVQIVEMREMIRSLKGGHTILVSSHILSEISQTCDRILMIHEGELVAMGTEEELSTSHRLHLVVRGEAEAVDKLLRELEGVTSCGPAPLGYHEVAEEDVHHFEVKTTEDRREQLSRAIIEAGHGLLHLGPAEAELESIFIQMTQKKEVIS